MNNKPNAQKFTWLNFPFAFAFFAVSIIGAINVDINSTPDPGSLAYVGGSVMAVVFGLIGVVLAMLGKRSKFMLTTDILSLVIVVWYWVSFYYAMKSFHYTF